MNDQISAVTVIQRRAKQWLLERWCAQLEEGVIGWNGDREGTVRTNINHLHSCTVLNWVWDMSDGDPYLSSVEPWTDYENPAPWVPTLQNVDDSLHSNQKGKIIDILNLCPDINVTTMDERITGDHIDWLQDLSIKFDYDLSDDDFSDEEEEAERDPCTMDPNNLTDSEIVRLEGLIPRSLFQDDDEDLGLSIPQTKGLCKQALEIVEGIVENGQMMNDFHYKQLSDVLMKIHNQKM
jgi:hypothetical protein